MKTSFNLVIGLSGLVALTFACAQAKVVAPFPSAKVLAPATTPPVQQTVANKKAPVHPKFQHSVKKGDCLWNIAGDSRYYDDAFLWPVIYKANRDEITDPDIIEVGQTLTFPLKEEISSKEALSARQEAEARPAYGSLKK